jgi:hypothetical protein
MTKIEDVLKHILTICSIYECSSDKVARIEMFSKHTLEQLKIEKKGEKDVNSNAGSKTRQSRKRAS